MLRRPMSLRRAEALEAVQLAETFVAQMGGVPDDRVRGARKALEHARGLLDGTLDPHMSRRSLRRQFWSRRRAVDEQTQRG